MSIKLRLILCFLVQVICTLNAQDDENAQLLVSLTPNGRISRSRGSRLEIVCEASSNYQDVEILIFKDKKRVRTTALNSNKFAYEIQRLDDSNAGTYLCRSYANERKTYEELELIVEVYDSPVQPEVCESRCTNGRCVSRSSICNGFNDCGDWSDEAGCSPANPVNDNNNNRRCEPTQETCSDRVTCKEKHWFCDGENDCSDGSDEYSCPQKRPSDVCGSTQFACSNRFQCISKAFVCDRSQDCPDNSDEIGCTVPKVNSPPVRTLEVCEGETIVLNCAAMGFPIPFINWRLNWGHVCDKPRCTMTNNDGSGVLTILRAQIADSGAYSCEAINNQGREIYPHDAIVTVKRCITPAPICNGYYVNGQCISCFCNGLLGVPCRGAGHLYYNGEAEDFTDIYHDWEVKEFQTNTVSKDVKTDTRNGVFEYTGSSGEWYFHVPSRFKGNRLASYGGELRFNIYFEGDFNENDSQKLEVRIGGSKIGLIYVHNKPIYPHEDYEIVIPLVETSFKRYPDDTTVTRDHMLMTLANVDLIMISASFVNDQQTSAISKFAFDYAKECKDPRRSLQKMADLVEICSCPSKYNGTSCENCNRGFVKGNFGTYLGTCDLDCQEFCYGNSNNCDERKCYNCENNTTGDRCEACAPGYVGNAKTSRCFKKRP